MRLSSFISKRLSLREGGSSRLSPAIVVAVAGISVAFTVMMLSIAVVGGFKSEITRKIMGFDAQVAVMPLPDSGSVEPAVFDRTQTIDTAVDAAIRACGIDKSEISVAMSADETGLLKTSDNFLGVTFRAYSAGHDNTFERSVLTEGGLPSGDNPRGVTISEKMASKLRLKLGDKVDAYFITGENIRPRRFEVTGIYSSGFSDYDDVVAFAPYSALESLLHLEAGQGERLEISGLEKKDIEPFATRLQGELNAAYSAGKLPEVMMVDSVLRTGAIYFNWLALLDTNVAVILILMGCVSAFMLITCVLILILQRVNMVGILKALGATDRQIRAVFLRLGARVILLGLCIGNALSLMLIFAESKWHLLPLDPDSYYLTSVPVEFDILSWLMLNVAVGGLSYLIMLLPTSMISRLSPVKTLHFE
jgi:hypothetical protein